MQPLSVSYLGFFVGAGLCWNPSETTVALCRDPERLALLLDEHVFLDEAHVMGRLVYDLGNSYLHQQDRSLNINGTLFGHIMIDTEYKRTDASGTLLARVEDVRSTRTAIESTIGQLDQTRMRRVDNALVARELHLAAQMALFGCDLLDARLTTADGSLASLDDIARGNLSSRLSSLLLPEFYEVWLLRNRPGGLCDSMARLEHILHLLDQPNTI